MISINTNEIFVIVNDFVNQLKYGNRFFIEHKVIDVMVQKFKELEVNVDSGKELFRARIDYDNEIIRENYQYSSYLRDLSHDHVYEQSEKHIEYLNDKYPSEKMNNIKDRIQNGFLGFNAENSYIPPITSKGRAQPKYVRYLYVAEDFQTAVCEVQPKIGHYVSVAKIKTIEPIVIVDISHISLNSSSEEMLLNSIKTFSAKEDIINDMIFKTVIMIFLDSKQRDDSYILSNYVSALVHKLGYDGVKFASTIHNNGKNITMFNDKCKCISSTLLQVKDCKIDTNLIKIDNINTGDLSEIAKHLIPNVPAPCMEKLTGELNETKI